MEEAVKAFAALRALDEAMYQEQPELAEGLGFVLETPPEEVIVLLIDSWVYSHKWLESASESLSCSRIG